MRGPSSLAQVTSVLDHDANCPDDIGYSQSSDVYDSDDYGILGVIRKIDNIIPQPANLLTSLYKIPR